MADLAAWWRDLSPEARQRLAENPYGPVPADLWSEVTRHGVAVAGAYFPGGCAGPEGFRLSPEVAAFVEQQGEAP